MFTNHNNSICRKHKAAPRHSLSVFPLPSSFSDAKQTSTMPYFNQPMAQSIMSGSGQAPPERTKQLRSMPGNAPNGASVVFKNSEASFHDRYRYEVSKRKLLFMRSLIQAQVTQLMLSPPLTSIDADAKRFNTYHIHQKNRIYEDSHLKMFRVTNKSIELPLMVRIYSRQEVDPNNSMYIKILRHLGRKHPKIVYSFDLFVDAKSIYVFQEYLAFGNLLEYLDKSPSVTENQARFWAKQLFDSLDFLGDQGIAHCNLNPTHLLIRQIGKEIWIKLTGFQRAIVYWNLQTNDIKRCPCFPAETQKADGPNFMAPETYGNPTSEEYDPILADTWSYGANVYYMLASQYPFNLHGPMEDLDGEILANIRQLPTLNADGQDFLYSTMRANANDRMPFDFIGRNSWLKGNTGLTNETIISTPFKTLEKIKKATKSRKSLSSQASSASGSPTKSTGITNAPHSPASSPTAAVKNSPASGKGHPVSPIRYSRPKSKSTASKRPRSLPKGYFTGKTKVKFKTKSKSKSQTSKR